MGDETSPRPWSLPWNPLNLCHDSMTDRDGREVLSIRSPCNTILWPTLRISHADAAFIVRAVNAHDDLVSALEDTLSALDEYLRDNGAPDGPVETRARSLLEKVKHGR